MRGWKCSIDPNYLLKIKKKDEKFIKIIVKDKNELIIIYIILYLSVYII